MSTDQKIAEDLANDLEGQHLALLLDKMAGDLADDLEWALSIFDKNATVLPKSQTLAERFVEARRHLKTRRLFEASCDQSAPKPHAA